MKNVLVGLSFVVVTAFATGSDSANAAVYCKYIGVPKGCVARPGVVLVPAPAVAAPAVVYCQYAGVPAGCVVRPGVVLAPAPVVGVGGPGVGVNRGGPVNRVGRR